MKNKITKIVRIFVLINMLNTSAQAFVYIGWGDGCSTLYPFGELGCSGNGCQGEVLVKDGNNDNSNFTFYGNGQQSFDPANPNFFCPAGGTVSVGCVTKISAAIASAQSGHRAFQYYYANQASLAAKYPTLKSYCEAMVSPSCGSFGSGRSYFLNGYTANYQKILDGCCGSDADCAKLN